MIAKLVAYWFVAQVCLNGAVLLTWLGWCFKGLIMRKEFCK